MCEDAMTGTVQTSVGAPCDNYNDLSPTRCMTNVISFSIVSYFVDSD